MTKQKTAGMMGAGATVRLGLGLGAALAMLAGAPTAARAQMRGGGIPVTPVGAALDKVPVGTWAEYEIKRGNEPGRKVRQALVGKAGATYVLETRAETGRGDKLVTQSTVGHDPSEEGAVKKVVTQFGAADPMEMPVGGAGMGPGAGGGKPNEAGGGGPGGPGRGMMMGRMGARFVKPDPKKLVGKETLKLAAGTFTTEHYRQEGPRGGTLDYWLAKDAGPFGLVKLELDRPAGGGGGDRPERGDDGGKVTMELVAKGKGATPEITKPAKPFDPEAMRARFGGRGGPGAPGGGPTQ
jgi:hypothetical protein